MTKENNPAEVGKMLKSITSYIRDCQARVTKGEIMDLQGLDKNVIEACNAVSALPPEEAHKLEGQMTTLIESLEALAETMKEQQENI